MKYFIGCDLGGTNLRAAIVDVETGSIINQSAVPTQAREGHTAVMQRMANLILELIASANLRKEQIQGIGIGAPGVLDLQKGETLFLPNLPGTWPHVPLRDTITALTGLPAAILNDVRSITLGEWRFGAGRGVDTVAVFAIGTGIGGGLVINGQLHLGIGGTGGELGHTTIDYNGPRCGCGSYGCLETYASGPAIAAMGIKAVTQGLTTTLGKLSNYDLNLITPALIAQAAQAGDEIARDIYEKVGFYLGVAAASICASIGPRRIIIAGGVANAGRLLFEPMARTLRERVRIMPVDQVEIVPALLGDNAGVIGAALWAEIYPEYLKMNRANNVPSNPYLNDILSQPSALRAALDNYPAELIEPLRKRLEQGEFSRIVLTGMGSSYNAAYPAWLNLLPLPVPTIHINTAELLHYGQDLLDEHTLLWINSQSGQSVEVVRLLESLKPGCPAFQLSMCNNLESPMAKKADLAVPIYAGEEATVSTKTYINMLSTLMLASNQLVGGDWQALLQSMHKAADGIEAYVNNWPDKIIELDARLDEVDQLLILGRGASMGAVWNGSLINKEAAKSTFEGMNVADFRHGPMELASSRLTLLVLEGAPKTAGLNRELALEVTRLGGKVFWLGTEIDLELPTLLLPAVDEAARPLVEILPLQMLTIVMAQRTGFEPGKFRHIGKITLQE